MLHLLFRGPRPTRRVEVHTPIQNSHLRRIPKPHKNSRSSNLASKSKSLSQQQKFARTVRRGRPDGPIWTKGEAIGSTGGWESKEGSGHLIWAITDQSGCGIVREPDAAIRSDHHPIQNWWHMLDGWDREQRDPLRCWINHDESSW